MLKRLYEWYGKKKVISVIVLVLVLVAYGLISVSKQNPVEITETKVSEVLVTTASNLSGATTVSLIGTVRPQSEVKITNERGGKVTSINTALGKSVFAGQVIVSLENGAERAALLQAEGAYEAAQASAASSDSGLREAESRYDVTVQSAISTNDSAYIIFTDSLFNTVDDLFSSPTTGVIGLRITGNGQTEFLNSERVAFRQTVTTWNRNLDLTVKKSELLQVLSDAKANSQRLLNVVDIIVPLLQDSENSNDLPTGSVSALSVELTSVRNRLVGSIGAIDNTVANLNSAEEALTRASIGAQGGQASLSDAQLKQALGSLRAAQNNFEKTLLRSPITGTVNSFDVKVGSYLNSFSDVAVIANNTALEIVVYASDKERAELTVGDNVVLDSGLASGTVSSIAPAIDSNTKKTEVRISIIGNNVKSGATIRVEKVGKTEISGVIKIPLTAVKFTSTTGNIFVVENDVLVARELELGDVIGSMVEVISGLDANTEFVVDARGHNKNEKVVVITK